MKKQAFYSAANAIGDLISATPTIRKLAEIFNSAITVISKQPHLFENLPYVEESLNFDSFTEEQLTRTYDLHKSFFLLGKQDSNGIEFKHAMCDLRQFHAKDLGFMLTPSELNCDYIPKQCNIEKFNLPDKYIVIHPCQSWDSRTWSKYNWQSLCSMLEKSDVPVIVVGKDAVEYSSNGTINKPVFKLDIKNGIDLSNRTTLDETWYIINNATCVVTMDSGILHLAGTTNTYILQLGSSIKPEYRAPWRKSSQNWKYEYVAGSCGLHCASDLKYSLRDWGHIQSVTLIATCLENKQTFECNPTYNKVFESVIRIWNGLPNDIEQTEEVKINQITDRTLIEIQSSALGDTVGALAVIEKYRTETGKKLTVLCKQPEIFKKSYPEIELLDKSHKYEYLPSENSWLLGDRKFKEKILTTYKFDVPLLQGYAQDFGIDTQGINLKVDKPNGQRPIISKYVCIGVHSTAQCKYWNHPGAWDELCRLLRKKGLTPVCVEKDWSFGIQGHMNEVPSKAVKKIGLPFNEVLNYIQHAEMFIGLSSGLSWVAQGLGIPTVIISNATSKDNEFIDEKTLRIYEESVCHGCFHKYPFNSGDWLWCPVYRDDEMRRFICTKAITPESVMQQIEKFYNI